jgi:1-acyl-sn-glycerol-3-phosphate acyltransferase
MALPPRLVRRLVFAPLVVALDLATVVLSPLALVIAAIVSPLLGGRRPLRATLIVVSFALHHLLACLRCLRVCLTSGRRDDDTREALYDVVRSFVGGFYRTVVRVARVHVRVSDSAAVERLLSSQHRPAVVLSRHAGEGDTLLVLHHLLCRYRRLPRVVMHELLRLDPLIDTIGGRLPNRFVDPRGGDTERDIADLARDMDARSALLIFPEGGNATGSRRNRAIERLERAGHRDEAQVARGLRHLVAPRPGGALAAIEAAPDPVVIFVGHVGFPTSIGEVWRLLPHRQTVEVRLWAVPATDVPADPDEAIDWLFGWWQTIDGWVSRREAAAAA